MALCVRLDREVGRGSFAAVWLASVASPTPPSPLPRLSTPLGITAAAPTVESNLSVGLPVALKAIETRRLNRKVAASLHSEMRVMRALQHPHVVRLFSIFETSAEKWSAATATRSNQPSTQATDIRLISLSPQQFLADSSGDSRGLKNEHFQHSSTDQAQPPLPDLIVLALEFCPWGDLGNYIKRRGLIDQLFVFDPPVLSTSIFSANSANSADSHTQQPRYPASLAAAPAVNSKDERERFYIELLSRLGLDENPLLGDLGGISEPIVRLFLYQLASSLHFLRLQNLIHRDLKPQNILLCPPPNFSPLRVTLTPPQPSTLRAHLINSMPILKLADFGFARHLMPNSLASTLCGSPLYMAPEILRYEKYDHKADLWSLGCVLYECVCGRVPFRAQNHLDLLKKIEQHTVRFPDERRSPRTGSRSGSPSPFGSPSPRPYSKSLPTRFPDHNLSQYQSQTQPSRTPSSGTTSIRTAINLDEKSFVTEDFRALVKALLKRNPVERIGYEEIFRVSGVLENPVLFRPSPSTPSNNVKDTITHAYHPHHNSRDEMPMVPGLDGLDVDEGYDVDRVGLGLFVRHRDARPDPLPTAIASSSSSPAQPEVFGMDDLGVPFEGYQVDMRMLDSILEETPRMSKYSASAPTRPPIDLQRRHTAPSAAHSDTRHRIQQFDHHRTQQLDQQRNQQRDRLQQNVKDLSDSFGVLALSEEDRPAQDLLEGYVVVPKQSSEACVQWFPTPNVPGSTPRPVQAPSQPSAPSASSIPPSSSSSQQALQQLSPSIITQLEHYETSAKVIRDFIEILDRYFPTTGRGYLLALCLKALSLFSAGLDLSKRIHALHRSPSRDQTPIPLDLLSTKVMSLQSGFNACLSYAEHLQTPTQDPINSTALITFIYSQSLLILQMVANAEMNASLAPTESKRLYRVVKGTLSVFEPANKEEGEVDVVAYRKIIERLDSI